MLHESTDLIETLPSWEEVKSHLPATLYLANFLGGGGSAHVYELTLSSGKKVVFKVFNSDSATERFDNEVKILGMLKSEFIVKMIGTTYHMGSPTIVLEWMELNLLTLLSSQAEISAMQCYHYARDIVHALKKIHQSLVIHGDLKSLNILIRRGRAKIADFEGSQILSSTSPESKSSMSKLSVTLRWSAPEILKVGIPTQEGDVYSFGVVLWELYTRKIPYNQYPEASIKELLQKGISEKLPPSIPGKISSLISSCWSPDPTLRPKAQTLSDELDTLESADLTPLIDQQDPIERDNKKAPVSLLSPYSLLSASSITKKHEPKKSKSRYYPLPKLECCLF